MIFHVPTPERLPHAVREILRLLPARAVVLLSGPMGAGKTTFVAEVTHQLEMPTQASSPTFAIHQQYKSASHTIEHFDLFRCESEDQVETSGIWDLLAPAMLHEPEVTTEHKFVWVMVEWPSRLRREDIPQQWSQVEMDFIPRGDERQIVVRISS
jgi:tRNA threonylcarbamoyladenosine biosynthesis protein TsaE